MQTDHIDALFLELSQFTKAKTKRELALVAALENVYVTCGRIENLEAHDDSVNLQYLVSDMRAECKKALLDN